MTEMLDAGLIYAARSWLSFALKPRSKDPATLHGSYDATCNPAKIRRWFARGFPHNNAVRTGLISGLLVFDCDGEEGASSRRRLELKYAPLPPTLMSKTSRGFHLWF